VLFTLYLGSPARAGSNPPLPAVPVTAAEKVALGDAVDTLRKAVAAADPKAVDEQARVGLLLLGAVVGYAPGEPVPPAAPTARGPVQGRLHVAEADARAATIVAQADKLRDDKKAAADALDNAVLAGKPLDDAKAKLAAVADGAVLLAGRGELPARNVAAVGYSLYSEHLLAVELAGTLLLVATVGAVAVAGRRRQS
jgi:hypothetical protein